MKTQSKTPTIANVVTKHSISSELAQKMVDEAMVKARQLGVTENVAILDDGGNLKAFGRMEGAPILCIEMAQNKAYTALFGISTQEFFDFIQRDPSLLAGIPTLARMAAWGGGFPIKVNGEVVGAIGLSGAELIAQATGRLFGAHPHDPPESVWLAVKFSPSAAGQAAGREFLKRTHLRQEGRDPEVNDKVSPAQVEAIGKWGVQQKGSYDYLKTIKQPTLVVNGSNDVNLPTVNSFIMQQNIPYAELIIYPDSNHGAHHQYPELFVEHATLFLNG